MVPPLADTYTYTGTLLAAFHLFPKYCYAEFNAFSVYRNASSRHVLYDVAASSIIQRA